jgi:hypothetical protein
MWRSARAVAGALGPLSLCLLPAVAGADPPGPPPPFSTTFPFGLLRAGATARHYSTALDLDAPLLHSGSGADFMAAARADAQQRLGRAGEAQSAAAQGEALERDVRAHLAAACSRSDAFLSSGAVHDREEIKSALEDMLRQRGQLALLLGGKSVGKSLLLAELAQRTDIVGDGGATRAVLLVDSRRFSTDLAAGLQAALLGENRELESSGWWARLGLAGLSQRRAQAGRPVDGPSATVTSASLSGKLLGIALKAKAAFAAPLTPMQRNMEALSRVVELAEAQGLYVCLVVDEANLAFPTPPGASPGDSAPLSLDGARLLSDTQLLLERLVLLTKQTRRLNVLIVTSEYSFPYRLQHNNFFNTDNLTDTFFAGEVPPAAMRALLQEAWGVGPRLSDVMLAYFGGHVYLASRALRKLAVSLDGFTCESVAPQLASHSLSVCLQPREDAAPMEAMLRALAAQGFAPVENASDACAQRLSRANLGGLVATASTVVGLPEALLRGGAGYGVVPASHFTRHLIVKALHEAARHEAARRALAAAGAPPPPPPGQALRA